MAEKNWTPPPSLPAAGLVPAHAVIARAERGDILQISPNFAIDRAFAGCLLTVQDVHDWGVTGYVYDIGRARDDGPALAFVRVPWNDLEPTNGRVKWYIDGDVT